MMHYIKSDCMKAIVEALKLIPKKFDKVWVKTNEVTYEYLKKERDKQDEKTGGLCTRRVYVSYFNSETHEAEMNDAFDVDNKEYVVKYWPSKPDDITIEVAKEKNLITGEIGSYWVDYYKSEGPIQMLFNI